MSMFDTVKDMISKTAKDAAKVSGTAVEYTKSKFKLSEVNHKINEKYAQIGKMVYSTSIGEDVDSDEIEKICSEIANLLKEAEAYEDAANKAANKKVCPNCGAAVSGKSVFCNKCGNKIDNE